MQASTNPKYAAGQTVEVWTDGGIWRPAVIVREPAYYHRGNCWGYEVQYLTGTAITEYGVTPSQGGWKSENSVRVSE